MNLNVSFHLRYIGVLIGPPLLGGLSVLFNGLRWSFLADAAIVFCVSAVALLLRIRQERRDISEKDFEALS
jgi:MFS family permease